jgi:hypothetical protein
MSTWDDKPNDYAHALVYARELQERISTLVNENERLHYLAAKVCWFDWSDNDADAVAAIDELRSALVQGAVDAPCDRPRWIADLNTMELTERQSDNSYRVAYTLKPVKPEESRP